MKNQPVASSHDESYKDDFDYNDEDDNVPTQPPVLAKKKSESLGGLNAVPTQSRNKPLEKPKHAAAASGGRFDYLNFGKEGSEKSMTSRLDEDEKDDYDYEDEDDDDPEPVKIKTK